MEWQPQGGYFGLENESQRISKCLSVNVDDGKTRLSAGMLVVRNSPWWEQKHPNRKIKCVLYEVCSPWQREEVLGGFEFRTIWKYRFTHLSELCTEWGLASYRQWKIGLLWCFRWWKWEKLWFNLRCCGMMFPSLKSSNWLQQNRESDKEKENISVLESRMKDPTSRDNFLWSQ